MWACMSAWVDVSPDEASHGSSMGRSRVCASLQDGGGPLFSLLADAIILAVPAWTLLVRGKRRRLPIKPGVSGSAIRRRVMGSLLFISLLPPSCP